MKKIKTYAGLAVVAMTVFIACSSTSGNETESGNVNSTPVAAHPAASGLPAFAMKDLQGNDVNLQSLKGKKVMVNLWASWCPPCRAEMPSIEKLYASVDKEKVAFVLLSFDNDPEAARKFKQSNQLTPPVYFPSEKPPAMFNTDGIPATFIFNETGELIKKNYGAEDYDTDEYRQLFK